MFQLLITGRARTQLPAFSAAAIDEGLSSSRNDNKFTHDLVIFPHLQQQFPMDIDKMSSQPVSDARLIMGPPDIPAPVPTMLKSSDHDRPPSSRSSLNLELIRFHDPILGLSRSLHAGCSDKHPNGLHPLRYYSHNKHHDDDDHAHMLLQCLHVIMQISQASSPSLLLSMQENQQLISHHMGRPYWETLNMLAQDIWLHACGNLQDSVSPDIAGYIPFLQQLAGDLADVTT